VIPLIVLVIKPTVNVTNVTFENGRAPETHEPESRQGEGMMRKAIRLGDYAWPLALVAAISALAMAVSGVSAAPASAAWSVESFDGGVFDEDGATITQAGGHAFTATTTFLTSTEPNSTSQFRVPTEDLKDALVELPPGVVGNPQAVGSCTAGQLSETGEAAAVDPCPLNSQVGTITIYKIGSEVPGLIPQPLTYSLFNMKTPPGTPALFGLNIGGNIYQVAAKVRTGDDYGVTAGGINISSVFPLAGVTFTLWGVPSSPHWDPIRFGCMNTQTGGPLENKAGCPVAVERKDRSFFTLQTACTPPQETVLHTTTWQGSSADGSFISHDDEGNPVGTDGCENVPFAPTFSMQPDTGRAETAAGFDFELFIPQHEAPDEIATSHLRKAVVTLPDGVAVNPSAADGLGACTPAQIELSGPEPARCPDSSKVGTVEIETPLLDHIVDGSVYLASQSSFEDSLISTYIAINDPRTGVVAKLGGTVSPDPATGQLKAVFDNQPQLPFNHLRLHFKDGSRAALTTPAACGTYSTKAEFYGWAGNPPTVTESSFTVDRAPDGGACKASPFAPKMAAGVRSAVAGGSSPFDLRLTREDGEQEFASLGLDMPPGLLGSLSGVSRCSDAALAAISATPGTGAAEIASPSCPANSLVGTVIAGAGAGSSPYYAQTGRLYLGGPYNGAPLSLVAVIPAVAGPFDLGSVVVRNRVEVDADDAQVHIQSDPLPTILSGIPLKVRDIRVSANRPGFIRTPTNCEPMAVDGVIRSSAGATATPSNRFQASDCGSLRFKPQLSLRLKGGVHRNQNPRLLATLTAKPGEAATGRVSVALPHSEFLDNEHIRTICTRVQFAAKACPTGSIYGTATVQTPLLDETLTGNVYLRSSSNPLPDMVVALRGPDTVPIEVNLVGRIDSVRGGIRTTFDAPPDAPLTKFVLDMRGGKRGLLVNSREICKAANKATVKMDGQNGMAYDTRVPLKADCRGKGSK
jgi:hypothetical protein